MQVRSRNVERFRGGLVFEAQRLSYHSTLGWIVIKKKEKKGGRWCEVGGGWVGAQGGSTEAGVRKQETRGRGPHTLSPALTLSRTHKHTRISLSHTYRGPVLSAAAALLRARGVTRGGG